MKILVCDDDPAIRQLLEVVLVRRGGHEVVAVADAGAVPSAVREHRPDIVLLDCVMPGAGGMEVARLLREDPGPAVPIVLLTGLVDVADRATLEPLGIAGVIEKPFDTRTLGDQLVALTAVPVRSSH